MLQRYGATNGLRGQAAVCHALARQPHSPLASQLRYQLVTGQALQRTDLARFSARACSRVLGMSHLWYVAARCFLTFREIQRGPLPFDALGIAGGHEPTGAVETAEASRLHTNACPKGSGRCTRNGRRLAARSLEATWVLPLPGVASEAATRQCGLKLAAAADVAGDELWQTTWREAATTEEEAKGSVVLPMTRSSGAGRLHCWRLPTRQGLA